MYWKPWIVGAVALLVFDAVLVLGVRAYRAAQQDPVFSLAAAASAPVLSPVLAVPAAPPRPDREACINGRVWQYFEREQRWFELSSLVRCDSRKLR